MKKKTQKSLLNQANLEMQKGNYRLAIDLYKKAEAENPKISQITKSNIEIAKEKSIPKKPDRTQFGGIPARSEIGLKGNIDSVDDGRIQGWIYLPSAPENQITLELRINGEKKETRIANLTRSDVKAAGEAKAECGFSIEYSPYTREAKPYTVEILIAETKEPAFIKKIEIPTLPAQLDSLTKIANIIKREILENYDPSLHWASSTLIPKIIEAARETGGRNLPKYEAKPRATKLARQAVDIIIPIYDGHEETINCLNSVIKSKNKYTYNIIAINDCSPNQELTEHLKKHSRDNNYLLIENSENLGFVGTVNRGMRLNTQNDVILLNSDTLVPDGWIDQILAAAYSEPSIGTVTPFSNNATICSYPNFCQDNELPTGHDVNSLNKIAQESNKGKVIDLPTAHGFCMFIKRSVLDEVGFFDEKKWGKGYAEENDFSLRAEVHGWRNVMALDTFVQHLGSVSFSDSAEGFINKNLKILNKIYPDYAKKVSNFITEDPAKEYRNSISEKIISIEKESSKNNGFILFVSLTIGGGTEVATNDLSRDLRKEGIQTLLLTSPSPKIWRISSQESHVFSDYRYPEDIEKIISTLKELNVWHIHYHNTIEFDEKIWEIPRKIGCEYDITVHDYLSICPRVNLINETNKYCGEPSDEQCTRCIEKNGEHISSAMKVSNFDDGIQGWRKFYQEKFEGCRKAFTPSQDTSLRMRKYFPRVEFNTRPHPEKIEHTKTLTSTSNEINIAFIGAIGVHKGFNHLINCADHALKNNLPITFHVIGYTCNDEIAAKIPNIKIHGKYKRADLPDIIAKSKCTIAAILSVWPETFSYTFSEATRQGLKVITFNIGAPSDRLQNGAGSTIPLDYNAQEICSEIIRINKSEQAEITSGHNYISYQKEYYEFNNSQEDSKTNAKQ